jgi:LysM repeat protein
MNVMTDVGRVGTTTGFQGNSQQLPDEHVVQRGGTLWGIARQHGISLRQLEAANPRLSANDFIFPGDRLTVPDAETTSHVVRAGETVGGIAERHGTTTRAIVEANRLDRPDLIHPGDRLSIPRSAPQPDPGATPIWEATPATPLPARATDLRAMFDPARGSAAVGAVVIGQAEGTRTPSGGFRDAYYGHTDPGNGVANSGSFSLQHAAGMTPEQADARQLARLSRQIPAFETAARAAGLDPNNAALATAYLDLYNQSPTAAARFVDQLDYLNTNGVSADTLVDLRVRSFVNQETGERFRLPGGGQAGGGFVNIARQTLGREPTEREVQAVIRRDQDRRVSAMEAALPTAVTAAPAPAVPSPTQPDAPAQAPRFTSNAGLDLTSAVVNETNALLDAVRDQTGFALHVTSGRRGPDRQAAAMYDNFADNSSPRYRNQAAFNEVRDAYIQGRSDRLGRTAIVNRMTTVLQGQVDRGVFISRHMSDRAIDIRMPPAASRADVLAAIRDNTAVQSVGVEDDHLHIQFR